MQFEIELQCDHRYRSNTSMPTPRSHSISKSIQLPLPYKRDLSMTIKAKIFSTLAALFLGVFLWKYFIYTPGYCSATKHLLTDAQLISIAIKNFEGEVQSYGGFDGLEKHFIKLNRHPEEAGRSFDSKDPRCCTVFRGYSQVKQGCGLSDYPLCVYLAFPPLKTDPTSYHGREGRSVFFDDCGKVKRYF